MDIKIYQKKLSFEYFLLDEKNYLYLKKDFFILDQIKENKILIISSEDNLIKLDELIDLFYE